MYRCYELIDIQRCYNLKEYTALKEQYMPIGTNIFTNFKEKISETLKPFIGVNGIVNVKNLQEHWFPQIKADIFLSHSHKDAELATIVAGILKEELGLTTFIDSCIWGDSRGLLELLDHEHCYNQESNTYDYKRRNYTTNHLYIMLAQSLTKMIDQTECLMFLNTPNSISIKNDIHT
jgi:hypothetical protein